MNKVVNTAVKYGSIIAGAFVGHIAVNKIEKKLSDRKTATVETTIAA